MYYIKSSDAGKTFTTARKLGTDTWKLNGCPMDDGGIKIDQLNVIRITWQCKGFVYYCKPNEPEINIGNGRICDFSISGTNTVVTYQDWDDIEAISVQNKKTIEIGKGNFVKAILLSDNNTLYVWEQDDEIKFKKTG